MAITTPRGITMDSDDKFPAWNPSDKDGSLNEIYRWVTENAQKQADWYSQKRRSKRRCAQSLLVSIVLGGFGILCPLFDAACPDGGFEIMGCTISFLHAGYIVIAAAGIVLLVDRVYGFSAGWMRFMETELKIKQTLTDFCLDWAIAVSAQVPEDQKEEHQQQLLRRVHTFTHTVQDLVISETTAWMLEFKRNISEIDKLVRDPQKH